MANNIFTPRLTLPEGTNKYYKSKSSGGYNTAIKGNNSKGQRGKELDVLPNCVGFCIGRFHEILQDPTFSKLKPVNAELFIQYADKSLIVSQVPQVGAIAVWEGKGSHPGHVASVEVVKSPTEIITSESGWSSMKLMWTQTRKKGTDNNWGQNSSYKFLGFIYNPAPCCQPDSTNSSTNTSTNTSNIITKPNTSTTSKTLQVAKLKDTKLSSTYTVIPEVGLNLRYGAGENYDVMVTMPKGTKVYNYGYYNTIGNVKWLYVQCTVNKKKYTGYCSIEYLKKS